MKSKINNIVFYKASTENGKEKRACIFYRDGSVREVSYQEAIEACGIVAKEKNITSKNAFKEMINKEIVHVVSEQEFKKNYQNYVSKETFDVDTISKKIDERYGRDSSPAVPSDTKVFQKEEGTSDSGADDCFDPEIETPVTIEEEKKSKITSFFKKQLDKFKKSKLGVKVTAVSLAVLMSLGLYSCASRQTKEGQMLNSNLSILTEENKDAMASKRSSTTPTKSPTIANGSEEDTVIIDTTTAGNSAEDTVMGGTSTASNEGNTVITENNNDYYDGYTFQQLLNVTTNSAQKQAMLNLESAIQGFNGTFADYYVEEGKDIRAALTFEEVVALQQAYNSYSKEEIRAYFNGAEVRSDKMSRAYKDAFLQLMGAYIIEDRAHPVNMVSLIESEEGKEFYQKYSEMFLSMKEAEGEEELLERVNEWNKTVREDFPITEEVRTEGIAHADSYATIEPYKLSVLPMIAAAERMYQNLETEYTLEDLFTLNDQEYDFMDSLGLCDYANETFERIETITLTSYEDNTNPLYEQYKDSIVSILKENNQYVIDDEHRELSKLDSFQNAVNWHFKEEYEGISGTSSISGEKTETHQETSTHKEQHTTYREEVTREEKEIPASEREEIDSQIEKDNEMEKERAEEAAEDKRQELQDEADKAAEEVNREIEEDHKDMQDKIDQANEQIDRHDGTIKESDFDDHNVHFDDNHSDGNGTLDDSVENITTDSTGDQTNEELPDPNVTGAEFDRKAPTSSSAVSETETKKEESPVETETSAAEERVETKTVQEDNNSSEESTGYVEYVSDDAYIEYPSDFVPSTKAAAPSNEELVDAYVEAMAESEETETDYEYTR